MERRAEVEQLTEASTSKHLDDGAIRSEPNSAKLLSAPIRDATGRSVHPQAGLQAPDLFVYLEIPCTNAYFVRSAVVLRPSFCIMFAL